MHNSMRALFLAAGATLALAVAGGFSPAQKPDRDQKKRKSEVVKTIVSVDYKILESSPPILEVTATGQVPTGGWTGARLKRRTYVKPPADGIYEYDLTAIPPEGFATQVISKVKAKDQWKDPPKGLKGIKVYGVGKGVKTVMVKGL